MVWSFERVFIVRHGETDWNVEGRRQGQLDSPLTEAGRIAAAQVGTHLSALAPDALFSSPLGRARETAQIIGGILGMSVSSEEGLSEIHHGELAGLTDLEIEDSHPGLLAFRSTCLYRWRFPEGESYEDGDRRAAVTLREIQATLSRRPVLITHEMIARMLVRNLLGLRVEDALQRSFAQGAIYQISPPNDLVALG